MAQKKKSPKVRVEVPGYWPLADEDKAKIDQIMKDRAKERDAKKKRPARS